MFFNEWLNVEGLDLSPTMLAMARVKLPDVPLHQGDMRVFVLPRQFDVIACPFSAIGYVRSLDETGTLRCALNPRTVRGDADAPPRCRAFRSDAFQRDTRTLSGNRHRVCRCVCCGWSGVRRV